VDVKTTNELRISVTKHDARGWMPENYCSSRRGGVFSLDIPFYRTRQQIRIAQANFANPEQLR